MMEAGPKCPGCGGALRAENAGLCPACVLGQVLETESQDELEAEPALESIRYFGNYLLLREIARGGMGVVYKARQASLNRLVALKVVSGGALASPDIHRRFKVEAEIAASLNHPNIVPIFEIGDHETLPYFSMGLVEGPAFADRIRESPLPVREAVALMIKVVRAVHFAHQRGVLHRDLKPTNILLDAAGEPHLTDFGLAKLIQGDSTLTHTNAVLGTPAYMSPEQARGESKNLTTAADIYGLGAVLYHAITGAPPFAGGTSLETVRQVLERDPRPPSDLNPAVDGDLETICLKCLEKEPGRRYETALGLAEDLQRWLNHEPIQAKPSTSLERLKKAIRRHPLVSLLAAALVMAIAGGGVTATLQWRRAEEEKRLALLARDEARKAQHKAQGEQEKSAALLDRLDLKNADDLAVKGQSSEALAWFAHVLREGKHPVAAQRVISLLTLGNFIFPGRETPGDSRELDIVSPSPGARQSLILSGNGEIRLKDAEPNAEELRWPARGPVITLAWSPQGRFILMGRPGYRVEIWDAKSKTLVQTLTTSLPVHAFLTESLLLFSGWRENRLEVWRWSDLTLMKTLNSGSTAEGVVVNHEDNSVGASWGDSLELMEIPDLKTIRKQAATGEALFAKSPEGLLGFFNYTHNRIVFRDSKTLQAFPFQSATYTPINGLLFTTNALAFVTLGRESCGQLWDKTTCLPLSETLFHGGSQTLRLINDDAELAISMETHPQAQICDARPGGAVSPVFRHNGRVSFAVFDEAGRDILSTSMDGTARVWDAVTGKPITPPLPHEAPVKFGQISPSGNAALTVTEKHRVHLWNARTGRELCPPFSFGNYVDNAEFSRDGAKVMACSRDGSVGVMNLKANPGQWTLFTNTCEIRCARWSPDGKNIGVGIWPLEAGSPKSKLELWDGLSGKPVFSAFCPTFLRCLDFSSDGKMIAGGGHDGSLAIWDAHSGGEIIGWTGKDYLRLSVVQFSPDNQWLLAAGANKTVIVYNVRSGKWRYNPLPCGGDIWSAQFSRDGRRILTVTSEGVLRLWDAETGLPLSTEMPGHPVTSRPWICPTTSLLFSLNNDQAVVPGENGRVSLLNFPNPNGPAPAWLADLAESLAGRRYNADRLQEEVSWDAFTSLRDRFKGSSAQDDWTRWARWFFDDRGSRPVFPGSALKTPEFVESLIEDATWESLLLAARYQPNNPRILSRLALTIARDKPAIMAPTLLARHLCRKALELSPGEEGIKKRVAETEALLR